MRVLVVALLLFVVDVAAQERVRRVNDPLKKTAKERAQEATSAIVKGQCVDGATGKPLAGCIVEVDAWGRRSDDVPKNLLKPDKVVTGADGKFEVRVLAKEGFQVGFDAAFDGCWPRTGRWRYLMPGTVEDVGKVAMHVGVHAVGKLVDTNGKPVPGVSVGLDELRLYLGCENDKDDQRPLGVRLQENVESGSLAFHLHANKVRYGTTGDDGRFKSRCALPPGKCEVNISGRGLTLVEPKHIVIPEEGPMKPVTIVVRQEPYLGGVVVDEQGAPISRVRLHAQFRRAGRGRLASAITRKDGTFKIYRVANAGEEASITVMDPGAFERPAPTKAFKWGTKDIRIVMQRALSVPVRVVEAGTGKPVENFAVRGRPLNRRMSSSSDRRLRLAGHHEDGKLVVPGMPRGDCRISIIPKDTKLLCTTVDVISAKDMDPVTIELQRLVPNIVQVLDPKGQPVAKATVLVIVPGNRQLVGRATTTINNPRADTLRAFSSNPAHTFDTEIYRATTDAGGQCIVYGIGGRDDLILGVRIGRGKVHRDEGVSFGTQGNGHTVTLDEE